MKTQLQKSLATFILIITGMFSYSVVYSQTCSSGKVWTCRLNCSQNPNNASYGGSWVQECKCISPANVTQWIASAHTCNSNQGGNGNGNGNGGPNCWGCPCICRVTNDGNFEYSEGIYPNPVSEYTTISFFANEPLHISINIYNLNGQLISTIANGTFDEGSYAMEWDASNVEEGIYFLRMKAGDISQTEKIVVIK